MTFSMAMSAKLVKELTECNYKYGHILICVAQGRITDEMALEQRFEALEMRIDMLAERLGVRAEYNRKRKPPLGCYEIDHPWGHSPYYPLKIIMDDLDISKSFQVKL